MQEIECKSMSLRSMLGCSPGDRADLTHGEEAVHARGCDEGWEQNYALFLSLVSRGATVMSRSEPYEACTVKIKQILKEVLEAVSSVFGSAACDACVYAASWRVF